MTYQHNQVDEEAIAKAELFAQHLVIHERTAFIIEMVFGMFGMLGVGWVFANRYMAGLTAFLGMLVLLMFEALLGSTSYEKLLFLSLPLHALISFWSAKRASRAIRKNGEKGSLWAGGIFAVLASIMVMLTLGIVVTRYYY